MGFKNTIGTVGQKLIEYSVYNSPTQKILQAIGQTTGIRGPMGQPQIPAQGLLASNNTRAGGALQGVRGSVPYRKVAQFNRNPDQRGLLASVMVKHSTPSQR